MKFALYCSYLHEKPYQYSMPPLGLGSIGAWVKNNCWFCEVAFFRHEQKLIDWKPDIVGISSATENFSAAVAFAGDIKNALGIPVWIGGTHITALPHTLPDCFDVGILGEGELTVAELIKIHYKSKNPVQRLADVAGICYHGEKGVVINPPRDLIPDIDILPFPDRKMLGEDWAVPLSEEAHIITSRGCPYDCTFCSAPVHWRKKVRFFSPEYVIREIEHIRADFNPNEIFFFDDLFIGNLPRFKKICALMKERNLHRDILFRTYARVDLIDEEVADLLADLNFHYVDFGFEANTQPILDYYNKKNATPEKNQRAIDLLAAKNISIGANVIIGAPHETREQMEQTRAFIERNKEKLHRCSMGPLQAPPGTRVWDYAKSRGLVSDDMDWTRYIVDVEHLDMSRDPYLCETMPVEEFTAFYEEFYRLATEINLRGKVHKMGVDLQRSRARERAMRAELDALKGSRLVRLAARLKRK